MLIHFKTGSEKGCFLKYNVPVYGTYLNPIINVFVNALADGYDDLHISNGCNNDDNLLSEQD